MKILFDKSIANLSLLPIRIADIKVIIADKRIPISESYKTSFFEKINL